MNRSFVLAVLFGLAIGYAFEWWFLHEYVLKLDHPYLAQFALAAVVSATYVVWVYHNTPTRNKTAVLLFGTWRWRMGPNSRGFNEGLNAAPLGFPFVKLEDKPILELTHEFKQMKAYSDDRIAVHIDGTFNSVIDDVYATYNISDEDAKKSVVSTVLKWIRAKVEDFKAEQLVSQEAGTPSAKELLATMAYEAAHAELDTPDANWGRNITKALQINHIVLDTPYESALRQREQENVEGQSEQTQINRRLEQIKSLTDKGVNADLAAAFVQVEAEKPGATTQTFNIPGLQGIGEGIGRASEAFKDFVTKKTT